MKKSVFPSIFNDAIGPIMRGPSSSHTAGSHRIGQVIRQLSSGKVKSVLFDFHEAGSLATTYNTQGSDIGLAAGLADMVMTDQRIPDSLDYARSNGITMEFRISDYPADHPNTYKCKFTSYDDIELSCTALSIGGGIIEFIELDGFSFRCSLDLPTSFIWGRAQLLEVAIKEFEAGGRLMDQVFDIQVSHKDNSEKMAVIQFKPGSFPTIQALDPDLNFRFVSPVYPVAGYAGSILPFKTAGELEALAISEDKELWECALDYESIRSSMQPGEVLTKISELVEVFRQSVDIGLAGTEYGDRILGSQSPAYMSEFSKGNLIPDGPLSRMTSYTMAIMEAKSSMNVIVAAPTAGSAGGLPGALLGLSEELQSSHDQIVKSFLAAGLIGVFISSEATFAAEVAGCQAETGVGAAMAAAGMVQLMGGTAQQAMAASSIALQNIMGLVCDPVANRVEIPCLGRNVQSGANALVSANLVLAGIDHIIPLSETIQTMLKVGHAMPHSLRCTAIGGLADTPTARRIEKSLMTKKPE